MGCINRSSNDKHSDEVFVYLSNTTDLVTSSRPSSEIIVLGELFKCGQAVLIEFTSYKLWKQVAETFTVKRNVSQLENSQIISIRLHTNSISSLPVDNHTGSPFSRNISSDHCLIRASFDSTNRIRIWYSNYKKSSCY